MRRTWIRAFSIIVAGTLLWFAGDARAQGRGGPRMVVIKGATVWTGTDDGAIENGTLVLRKDKIMGVGSGGRDVPPMPGIEIIDASGKYATPGLIDAWTMLAMDPGGSAGAAATQDAVDALDMYDRHVFADALRGGVTGVCIEPPAPSGIVGTAAFVRLADLSDLHSTTTDSMALVARIGLGVRGPINRLGEIKALHDAFEQAAAYREQWDDYQEKLDDYKKKLKEGETVKLKKDGEKKEAEHGKQPQRRSRHGRRGRRRGPRPHPRPRSVDAATITDAELLAILQDTHVHGDDDVLEAEAHSEADAPTAPDADKPKKQPEKKDGDKKDKKDGEELTKPERPAYDADHEVVVKALKRELPVRFEAHRPGDIAMAMKIIDAYHLDAVIVGATGSELVADRIADAELPVVFGQLTPAGGEVRSHTADFDAAAPAVLVETGVTPIAIGSGRKGGNAGPQYLTQNAAIAVGQGLDEDVALRAITIDAARICGVDETVGSLEKGKLADVVIWSGDPLAPDSVVERVFVGGVEVYRRAGS